MLEEIHVQNPILLGNSQAFFQGNKNPAQKKHKQKSLAVSCGGDRYVLTLAPWKPQWTHYSWCCCASFGLVCLFWYFFKRYLYHILFWSWGNGRVSAFDLKIFYLALLQAALGNWAPQWAEVADLQSLLLRGEFLKLIWVALATVLRFGIINQWKSRIHGWHTVFDLSAFKNLFHVLLCFAPIARGVPPRPARKSGCGEVA